MMQNQWLQSAQNPLCCIEQLMQLYLNLILIFAENYDWSRTIGLYMAIVVIDYVINRSLLCLQLRRGASNSQIGNDDSDDEFVHGMSLY